MLTTLLWLSLTAPSSAAEYQSPDALLEASTRMKRRGAWQLGLGAVGMGGGFALLTVGRPTTGISTESDLVREARDIGGIALILAGVTSTVVSVYSFDRARQLKRRAEVSVAPAFMPEGGGLTITARF